MRPAHIATLFSLLLPLIAGCPPKPEPESRVADCSGEALLATVMDIAPPAEGLSLTTEGTPTCAMGHATVMFNRGETKELGVFQAIGKTWRLVTYGPADAIEPCADIQEEVCFELGLGG